MAYEKEMDCRSNMFLSGMVLQYCFRRRAFMMLGEIEFVLLNTRWMYPGRTNHLFCCVHIPSLFHVSSVGCLISLPSGELAGFVISSSPQSMQTLRLYLL